MKIQYKEIPWRDPFDTYVLLKGDEPSFLLESLGGVIKTSRYSFIGINPSMIIKSKGRDIKIMRLHDTESGQGDPLIMIRRIIEERRCMNEEGLPPFVGGMAGYLGYDVIRLFERLPHPAQDDLNVPDIFLMVMDTIVAFDHIEKKGWIIVAPDEKDPYCDRYMERIEEIEQRIRCGKRILNPGRCDLKVKIVSNLSRRGYVDMVKRCKEYIASGDIFQANLSQRLSAYIGGIDPLKIYRILRGVNPSPFSAFIDAGDMQIVSSSPERLVRFHRGLVETRPIAGTRPRGKNEVENRRLRKSLLGSEKERAEHIMLLDLERNDLGRVCRYGSIEVDEFMVLESYSHVTHIVSNIVGEIGPGRDAIDIIKAVFPGGTITGVPKVRCMEIIDELEPTARGPYTGSIGYISYTGDMDFNIIIRSFIIKDGWAHVQVGAGIVADSDPDREYMETLYKAEALLKTLELV